MDPSHDFRHEYDLEALQLIRPRDHSFEMEVTPRYIHHYVHQSYEAFTADFLANVLSSHALFIDIGAHYGFYTLLAATRHPHLEVLALEPVPTTYSVLCRNIARNGLKNVSSHCVAVSSRDGRARFQIALSSDNCSFYPHPVSPPIDQIDVDTVTIDSLLADHPPCKALIKMDTDGHELEIVEGMRDTLSRFPDLSLVMELNPKMLRTAGHSPEEFLEKLNHLGFDTYFLDDHKRLPAKVRNPRAWRQFVDPGGCINVYCPRRGRSLNLCFFAHSGELGGAERSLLELVTELIQDHGAVCTVVLPSQGPLRNALSQSGAACISIPFTWWCHDGPVSESEVSSRLRESTEALLDGAIETVESINPDIVVTTTMVIPWGALVASLLGKPHVWHICEYGELDHGFHFFYPFEEVLEIIRSSSSLLLTATKGLHRVLFPQLSEERCVTIYRHITMPSEYPGEAQDSYYTRPGAIRLGVFATLSEGKGQQDAVRAIAELIRKGHDVELLLAGHASREYKEKLERLLHDCSIQKHVRLPGFLQDVGAAMRQTDIIVICSRHAAFSRVAVEGMSLAKPVIYTAVGGHLEYMLDGETGLAYSPGDSKELADRIEMLLARPDLRHQLGTRGQSYARQRFPRHEFGGKVFRIMLGLRGTTPAPMISRLMASVLTSLHDKIRSLEAALEERSQHRMTIEKAFEAAVEEHRRQQAHREQALQQREEELAEIQTTLGWRILTRYWQAVDDRFPQGTRRRRAYDALFRPLKWFTFGRLKAR